MIYRTPIVARACAGLGFVVACVVGTSLLLAQVPPSAGPDSSAYVVRGITAPSERRQLSFSTIGVIRKMDVQEGDRVKRGDVLATQDDVVEQERLKAMLLDADVSLTIKAREKQRDVKKNVLERKKQINDSSGGMNTSEVEEAQLDYDLSVIEVAAARRDGESKSAQADVQKARLEQMKLPSPIDGIVLKIDQKAGELADTQKPVLTVIRNDPLNIELRQLSSAQVARLKAGQELPVRYPGGKTWGKAKITLIAPEADARSDTQMIRLTMPNPEQRSTGLPIEVDLGQIADSNQGEAQVEKTADAGR